MIIEDVVFQHAEEAAFLWGQRSAAVSLPHYRLRDLSHLDMRLDAHLDGLRIAGDAGWQLLEEQLHWQEGGEVFAAAVIALESGSPERFDRVLEAGLSDYDGITTSDQLRGLISAFGWIPFEKVRHRLEVCLGSTSAPIRTIGIAGAALHRKDPGPALADALDSEEPNLRTRAAKAAGELGRVDLVQHLRRDGSREHRQRFYRAWALSLLGVRDAVMDLQTLALENDLYSERAVDCAARIMAVDEAKGWLTGLSSNLETTRLAGKGAGALGDPSVMSWLIQQMAVPDNARVAGEAFAMITGVDIAYEDLEGEWPDGYEAGPTDEPEDEDVAMDPDEDLPWPDAELVDKWWGSNRGRFVNGRRYFLGQPAEEASWRSGLKQGFQRQRLAAALELALSDPKSLLLEVRAPGFRQIAEASRRHNRHPK